MFLSLKQVLLVIGYLRCESCIILAILSAIIPAKEVLNKKNYKI
jgi:hypothetical protein